MDKNNLGKRTLVVAFILVAAFCTLAMRIVHVQVIEHDKYAEIARSERMKREALPAMRGRISDRYGEILVENQHVRDLVADRNHLVDVHVCRRAVARVEGVSVRDVAARYDDGDVFVRFAKIVDETLSEHLGEECQSVLDIASDTKRVRTVMARALEFDRAEELRHILAEKGIGGLEFEDSTRRYYPNPGRLTQVTGYVDSEGVGREGIEGALDEFLSGTPGYRLIERTRRSSELLSDHADEQAAINGADVELTVDMGLQNIVEGVVEEAWIEHTPEKIMVLAMNPNSGDVLAMASRPHFDQETREGVRKIHPISDRYEPGSTFKIVGMAAAFDQGFIKSDSVFFCHHGLYTEEQLKLTDHRPYDYLNAKQILAQSSNIGAYLIAKQVGASCFHDYVKDFGFGARTGIALTSEAAGMVTRPSSRHWSRTSLSRNAMGYEVDVTALQMLNAYCVIANGGTLMKPQIIRKVTSADGGILYRSQPKKIRRVISEGAANEVRKALIAVTEPGSGTERRGTGTRAAIDGFIVAGKTGTALKPKADRSKGYHSGRYVVSFAGFLPAENPQLAIIVIVDDPKGGTGTRYGGTVAAPLFAKIAEQAMPYMGISPTVVARRAIRTLPRTLSSLDEERF